MKKGISLVTLAITIIVMIILAGVAISTGLTSYDGATLSKFALEILNIQTTSDEYYYRYNAYPTGESISLNVTQMDAYSLSQFSGETITNNSITLKIVNLSLLGINKTEFGNKATTNDVYAVSETTGKVYYLDGIQYEGVSYYTVTEKLYEMVEISSVISNNNIIFSQDIKKYDVIFSISNTNYTNQPITVTVKIPETATFNSVTVTGSKSISAAVVLNRYNTITINETSTDRNGNYDITVVYTYNGTQKTATHSLTNFDNTAPTIEATVSTIDNNKILNISTTDVGSGIKTVKYAEKEITDDAYFEYFGKTLTGSELVVSSGNTYTIYVEDKAGNYTTTVKTIT